MIKQNFEIMKTVLGKVAQSLLGIGVTPFLSGSFALCVYAGELIGNPQDIDFLFRSRQEHDQAVAFLEEKCAFKRIKQLSWESETGDESMNTKLISPEQVEFDLAYTMGDIELFLDPKTTILIEGVAVPVLSLEDIQKSYQRFFEEKPGSQQKIDLIEKLSKR